MEQMLGGAYPSVPKPLTQWEINPQNHQNGKSDSFIGTDLKCPDKQNIDAENQHIAAEPKPAQIPPPF